MQHVLRTTINKVPSPATRITYGLVSSPAWQRLHCCLFFTSQNKVPHGHGWHDFSLAHRFTVDASSHGANCLYAVVIVTAWHAGWIQVLERTSGMECLVWSTLIRLFRRSLFWSDPRFLTDTVSGWSYNGVRSRLFAALVFDLPKIKFKTSTYTIPDFLRHFKALNFEN